LSAPSRGRGGRARKGVTEGGKKKGTLLLKKEKRRSKAPPLLYHDREKARMQRRTLAEQKGKEGKDSIVHVFRRKKRRSMRTCRGEAHEEGSPYKKKRKRKATASLNRLRWERGKKRMRRVAGKEKKGKGSCAHLRIGKKKRERKKSLTFAWGGEETGTTDAREEKEGAASLIFPEKKKKKKRNHGAIGRTETASKKVVFWVCGKSNPSFGEKKGKKKDPLFIYFQNLGGEKTARESPRGGREKGVHPLFRPLGEKGKKKEFSSPLPKKARKRKTRKKEKEKRGGGVSFRISNEKKKKKVGYPSFVSVPPSKRKKRLTS